MENQKRTKDYRVVLSDEMINVSPYTIDVNLGNLDLEQEIYKKAYICMESFKWSYLSDYIIDEKQVSHPAGILTIDASTMLLIYATIPQIRTLTNVHNFNLGNSRLIDTVSVRTEQRLHSNGCLYLHNYADYDNSHGNNKIAVPISSLQSNFQIIINNDIGLMQVGGKYNMILKIVLSE
jgi:hypothetical protein